MEIFKDIKGYEGLYQISNYGNVKSFVRSDGRILKPGLGGVGYLTVALCNGDKKKSRTVHQLVAEAFLNHEPCGYKLVVDHIDNDPLNNNINNLQLVSQRQNTSKKKNTSSKYTGVHFNKKAKKWQSTIRINGIKKYLGSFNCETKAHLTYQNKLKTL